MDRDDREKLFVIKGHYLETTLRTPDNKAITLNKKQIDEIIEHSLSVVCTGVDFSLDLWAIQWPNNYKVQSIIL